MAIVPTVTAVMIYLLCFNSSNGQDYFTITRSTKLNYDVFKVPSCNSCTSYVGANVLDSSSCKCACKYESSTFGFHNTAWKCQDNAVSRQQAGCIYYFEGKTANKPVQIVADGKSSFKLILPLFNCNMEYSNSKYRKCDGTWFGLDTLVAAPGPFSVWGLKEKVNTKYRYTINTKSNIVHLSGMLITLSFKCGGTSSCVLFKVAGTSQCPVKMTQPTTSTTTPPTTTAAIPTTTSPTTATTRLTSSSSNPISVPVTNEPHTTAAIMTTSSTTTTTQSPGNGKPHGSSKSTSTGVIAAIAVIIIIIVVVGIMFGYIFWKRKRGENVWLVDRLSSIASKVRRPPSKAYTHNGPEESVYAEIPERPNDIRSKPTTSTKDRKDPNTAYAQAVATNDDLVYEEAGTVTSLSVDRRNCFIGSKDGQQYQGLQARNEQTYNELENPNSPEYNELENFNSPVYNELENPNSPQYNELENLDSPIYNELEGPKSPEYFVIDGPNEQQYKELENPNTPAYLTLKPPDEQSNPYQLDNFVKQTNGAIVSDPLHGSQGNRRRPPSPPRRNGDATSNVTMREAKDRGNTAVNANNGQDRSSVYEQLQANVRPTSVYEPLHHSTLSRKC